MILTRAPLRISFAGGGSDLPAYTRHAPGAVFSAAIRMYMRVAYNPRPVERGIRLAYSKTENVPNADALTHDIARETLGMFHEEDVEIHSVSDVPAGTGLGSSSAYTVALLLAIHAERHMSVAPKTLALMAGQIEVTRLSKPIGYQDHYASAYGGLRMYSFNERGATAYEAVDGSALESRLMLVYLGAARNQTPILQAQAENMNDSAARGRVAQMVDLAYQLHEMVCNRQLDDFGSALHDAWMIKRTLSSGISNERIDTLYETARKAGALGGKLCGAGGAGFLLFYVNADKREAVTRALGKLGIQERDVLPVLFDTQGAKVVCRD